MTSDRAQPSSPSELKRLLDVLDRAGARGATTHELAELIWLASHSSTPAHAKKEVSGASASDAATVASTDAVGTVLPGSGSEQPQVPSRSIHAQPHHSDAEPPVNGSYASLMAPLPPMLTHTLPLQRALRPLRRRVPSRLEMELDERSTAYRIAHQGAFPGTWLPTLRAKPERWLTLYFVYDAGPTMPIWRPLLRELHRVIGQTGAFRGIKLLELTEQGRLCQTPGGRPAPLPPRDGRAVSLLLSDCSGPQWYTGSEAAGTWYRTLGRWARTMPVAVIQPLPERLWRRTALRTAAGLLTARGPAVPNSALRFTPFDMPEAAPAGLPLPVLEPSARWFEHWAQLVAGPLGTDVPGVAATLPINKSVVPRETGQPVPAALTPHDLVLNFRAHASPQALRFAAHLAVGEPSLPMMRLVQAATEARPEPQHLAEVILSGLLTTAPGRPATSGEYVFRPGVREVLHRTLPRSTAARIGAVIQHHAGSRPGEFPVEVPSTDTEEAPGLPVGEPLAVVTEETVQRLGPGSVVPADGPGLVVDGRYRLEHRRYAQTSSDTWLAMDEHLDRTVVVKFFHEPLASPEARLRFLADAERLAALEIQGLAPLGGFGFHIGRPYLVTDSIDEESLGRMLDRSPGTQSPEVIRAVGGQIAEVLTELHRNDLLHLDLSPSALVVRRDGRVLLTDPGLGIYGLPDVGGGRRGTIPNLTDPLPPYRSPEELCANRADQRSDLYALGCLLYTMATGSPAVLGARVLRNAWVHGQAYSHQDYRFGLAPEFDALVRDLLATDPEYRPAHATEVLDRLLGTRPEDDELATVARAVLALAPDGTRMGRVLRDAIDGVLDGEQTGRYDTRDMLKMEKTHLGTLVEIAIQREFRFEDGHDMDFRIAGIEVDCKFSLRMGGWMFPPETVGHICLLVWMDDYQSRWSAGLLRVRREWLNLSGNRDLKATLKAEHRNEIQWLWHDAELPENILLNMSDEDRRAVLEQSSGQARLNELFRRVQRRRIGHNVIRTVVQQKDYMKRVRGNGGARSALRHEGIIIMGDYQAHQDIARQLGLPVPRAGEFVSARVVPAVPGTGLHVAEIDGQLWSVGSPEDPVAPAPVLPPTSSAGGQR